MSSNRHPQNEEPDGGNDVLVRILLAVAVALVCILLAAIASFYPESLFTKILVYLFIGVTVVGFLFRGVIIRIARGMWK